MMSPADIGVIVNESNEFMPNAPITDRAHLTLFYARLKNGFAGVRARRSPPNLTGVPTPRVSIRLNGFSSCLTDLEGCGCGWHSWSRVRGSRAACTKLSRG